MTRKELSEFRKRPCIACDWTPSEVAHIRSRGAGGKNGESDCIPLCREHHVTQHAYGWKRFLEMFPKVRAHIESLGWEFAEVTGRFLMFKGAP